MLALIGISIGVVIAVQKSPSLQNAVLKAANTSVNINQAIPQNTNVTIVTPSPDRQSILFTARNFSELYGSYSNENDGSNLLAAQQYATTSYTEVLRNQAITRQGTATKKYFGQVAKALAFNVSSQTATTATVLVSMQISTVNGTATATFTKDIQVDLIKTGGNWKVNAAVWK